MFASDPGPGYGCLVWGDRVFTVWEKTGSSPYDAGWNGVEYFKSTGEQYIVTYSNDPECGYINPNKQFYAGGTSCFVKIAGKYQQGAVGQLHDLKVCNLPLDDHIHLIVLAVAGLGVFFLRKNGKLAF